MAASIRIFFLLLSLTATLPIAAQVRRHKTSDGTKNNVIKLELVGLTELLNNNYRITGGYERMLSEKISVQLVGGYRKYTLQFRESTTQNVGFSLTPEARYYFTWELLETPRGFYGGPLLHFNYLRSTYTDADQPQYSYSGSFITAAGGGTVGFQYVFFRRLSLDAFVSPFYQVRLNLINFPGGKDKRDPYYDGPLSNDRYGDSGLDYRFGIYLGYVF